MKMFLLSLVLLASMTPSAAKERKTIKIGDSKYKKVDLAFVLLTRVKIDPDWMIQPRNTMVEAGVVVRKGPGVYVLPGQYDTSC